MHNKHNTCLLKALARQPVTRTPIWIMRQAGRYLPEYCQLRAQAKDFMSMCQNIEMVAKITLLPIERFALDAAILFSDILILPWAMDLNVQFADKGPEMQRLSTQQQIVNLPDINVQEKLGFVLQAIKLIQRDLPADVPLIGFAGSPWTIATYMVEGGTSKQFNKIKKMLYQSPQTLELLLNHLSEQIIKFLCAQVQAGVDVLMLFDSWAGALPRSQFLQFSLHYMQKIVARVKQIYPDIPIILYVKNAGNSLVEVAASGCQAIGLDWLTSISWARQTVGDKVALQGQLDPGILYANDNQIMQEVADLLQNYGPGSGHVVNLGHGIFPDCDPGKVKFLIEVVKELSMQYHCSHVS